MFITNLFNKIFKTNTEAEGEETLDHDIVMIRQDGQMVEVTTDDSEKGKQE